MRSGNKPGCMYGVYEEIAAYMILCDVSAARQKSGGGSVNFILRIK